MSDPVRRAFSEAELVTEWREFLRAEYGPAKDLPEDTRAEYYTRIGLMVHFAQTLFVPKRSSP